MFLERNTRAIFSGNLCLFAAQNHCGTLYHLWDRGYLVCNAGHCHKTVRRWSFYQRQPGVYWLLVQWHPLAKAWRFCLQLIGSVDLCLYYTAFFCRKLVVFLAITLCMVWQPPGINFFQCTLKKNIQYFSVLFLSKTTTINTVGFCRRLCLTVTIHKCRPQFHAQHVSVATLFFYLWHVLSILYFQCLFSIYYYKPVQYLRKTWAICLLSNLFLPQCLL